MEKPPSVKFPKAGLTNAAKKIVLASASSANATLNPSSIATSLPEGEFRTPDGKIVGEHDGIAYYTIGQRKGLGLAAW
jgi:hypothetical protein